MGLGKLALRRPEQYHKIDSAKVYESYAEGLHIEEADEVVLLEKAFNGMGNEDDNDDDDDDDYGQQQCIMFSPTHITFPKTKKKTLRQMRLEGTMTLGVRKMDDTTFCVEVAKKGTVLDLKRAVQRKFEMEDVSIQISWPHVWGNFCLSFNNRKLANDSTQLQQLGIREFDELHFVRHLTMSSGQRQGRGLFTGMKKKERRALL